MPSYQKVLVLDSGDTYVYVQAAYVSHKLQANLWIKSKNEFISWSAELSEHVANIIMPLYVITSSDHTSTAMAKRNCCNKWSVIQRQESSSNGQVRVCSYETKSKLIRKHLSCTKSTCLHENTCVTYGQAKASRRQKMKKMSTVTPVMISHWIIIWKEQTT